MIKESARQMAVPIAFFATTSANAKIGESISSSLWLWRRWRILTIFRIFVHINGFYGQRNHNNGEHPCQDIRNLRAEGDLQQLYFVNSAIKLIGKRCC